MKLITDKDNNKFDSNAHKKEQKMRVANMLENEDDVKKVQKKYEK